MVALIDDRLLALQKKTFDELVFLPKFETENLTVDDKKINLTTYHDTLEADNHLFVVQATYQGWWPFTSQISAKGFEINKDGIPRELRPEELYDFT